MISITGLWVGLIMLGWCVPNYILMMNPKLTDAGWVSWVSAVAFGLISQGYILRGIV